MHINSAAVPFFFSFAKTDLMELKICGLFGMYVEINGTILSLPLDSFGFPNLHCGMLSAFEFPLLINCNGYFCPNILFMRYSRGLFSCFGFQRLRRFVNGMFLLQCSGIQCMVSLNF